MSNELTEAFGHHADESHKFFRHQAFCRIHGIGVEADEEFFLFTPNRREDRFCGVFGRGASHVVEASHYLAFVATAGRGMHFGVAYDVGLDAARVHRCHDDAGIRKFLVQGFVETVHGILRTVVRSVVGKGDKVATLELPYGIEGVALLKNLAKEDGSVAEVGESLDFKVMEFLKEEKRIVLSHAKTWQEKEEPKVEEKAKPAKVEKPKDVEKATLGDLESLAALKEQLEEGEKKKKAAATKKVTKEAEAE